MDENQVASVLGEPPFQDQNIQIVIIILQMCNIKEQLRPDQHLQELTYLQADLTKRIVTKYVPNELVDRSM